MTRDTPPNCEAERRNLQALHAITIQRGNGEWNLNKIRDILTGDGCECKPETTDQTKSATAS